MADLDQLVAQHDVAIRQLREGLENNDKHIGALSTKVDEGFRSLQRELSETQKPNFGPIISGVGVALTFVGLIGGIIGFTIFSDIGDIKTAVEMHEDRLFGHTGDGHPSRVEALTRANSNRLDVVDEALEETRDHALLPAHVAMSNRVEALERQVEQLDVNLQREMRDVVSAAVGPVQGLAEENRRQTDYLRNNYDQRATKHDLERMEDRVRADREASGDG